MIVVLNENGDANGDLFYDDGESIDSIESNQFFYAIFEWSQTKRQLFINVKSTTHTLMSNMSLNNIAIYGILDVPKMVNVDGKLHTPKLRSNSQIVDLLDLGLAMNENHTLSWSPIEFPSDLIVETPLKEPKYRVDCHPDPGR